MVYSFVTYSQHEDYFILVFDTPFDNSLLRVQLLPYDRNKVFGRDCIDIHSIKHRDPEVILAMLGTFGLTYILKDTNDLL